MRAKTLRTQEARRASGVDVIFPMRGEQAGGDYHVLGGGVTPSASNMEAMKTKCENEAPPADTCKYHSTRIFISMYQRSNQKVKQAFKPNFRI